MSSPRVSVIMPVYNGSQHLEAAIRSVLAQTCNGWELIVSDDGSTDDSYDLAAGFASQRPDRIRVTGGPDRANLGPGAARNRALSLARGDLVAFLDADDLWSPEKLALQLPLLDDHPSAGFVYGCSMCIDAVDRPVNEGVDVGRSGRIGRGPVGLNENAYASFVGRGSAAPTSTVVARTSLVRSVGGFPEDLRNGEDRVLKARLSREAPVYFLPEVVASYRIHADSISSRRTGREVFETQVELVLRLAEDVGGADPILLERARLALWRYVKSGGDPLHERLRVIVGSLGRLRSAGVFAPSHVMRLINRARTESGR